MNRFDLTPVTLGASGLGGRGDDAFAGRLADAMIASDLGNVDTSNNYANGRSETLLGESIARAGGLPDGHLVYSKADAEPGSGVFDGDRVKRSFEETTSRLGLDRLPIYHLHDPYSISFEEGMAPGGPVEALTSLRDQGLVDAIGVAAGNRALVERYVRTDAFDAVLTHNRYTLVDRSGLAIIRAAKDRDMVVFNAAPFGGGMLADSSAAKTSYGYHEAPAELLAFVNRLRELCREWNVDLAAAALHFSLRSPDVDSTVVGISSVDRLEQLGALVSTHVPVGFFDAVDELGDPPPSGND